uniref:Uncharacterized protein n=1 Tax=Rhizophora mucronata TaxID=61149 RepID=A0A2P2NVE8_RHIMU
MKFLLKILGVHKTSIDFYLYMIIHLIPF